MASFIRQSKVRHVFGTANRKDGCYEGFRVTNCAFDGNFIAANAKFVACCIEVGGGGAFIVIPIEKTGRLAVDVPKVHGHKDYVLDMQWNPYNDNMLATCSEDGSIKIWEIPDRGLLTNLETPLLSLEFHERRCVQILWHPLASSVLLSVSQEPKVCVWNLDEGVAEVEIESHPDLVYNAAWSDKGDKIVTSCRDKKFRIFDARTGNLLSECNGHEGSKPTRVMFVMNDAFLFSTGFSKMSERQYAIWKLDGNEIKEAALQELDTANSPLVPHYDAGNGLLFLAAKGDSVIRYYEVVNEEPYIYYIDTYQSNVPQRGVAAIQKRSVNVNNCEVMRFYKLQSQKTGVIEPISFTVPRKSELYQGDLYADTVGPDAALEAHEWFEGKDATPNYIDMQEFFVSKTKPVKGTTPGLKKGGLKGLKAKKDAKEAARAEAKEAVKTEVKEPPKSSAVSAPKVDTKADLAERPKATVASSSQNNISVHETKRDSFVERSSSPAANSAPPTTGSSVDPKALQALQDEVKTLKESERKMKNELKVLVDKLKDYEKLTGDIKLLCDAVKKNDERIAALESLVQEESDEEAEEESEVQE